jgi:urease accessory protein
MLRTIFLAAVLFSLAGPASAHPGHEASGFLHPFTGIDHLLAMVGVGVWAALLAVRKPASGVLVPLAFTIMMAIGAIAAFAGINLPFAEAAIIASVFVVGGLILASVRMPMVGAMTVVGLFAVFHGYAHALEAPAKAAGLYVLGFLVATALLQAIGFGLGRAMLRRGGNLGLRALGGVVVVGGALALITQ